MSEAILMKSNIYNPDYDVQVNALNNGVFADPFAFLGVHSFDDKQLELRAYIPGVKGVCYESTKHRFPYQRYQNSDLFTLLLNKKYFDENYQLNISYPLSTEKQSDVYSFDSSLI